MWFSAWFYCKACHDDIKDETLIKKCKCKNCKYSSKYLHQEFINLLIINIFIGTWFISLMWYINNNRFLWKSEFRKFKTHSFVNWIFFLLEYTFFYQKSSFLYFSTKRIIISKKNREPQLTESEIFWFWCCKLFKTKIIILVFELI